MIMVLRAYFEDCTISRLRVGEFQCMGLELPWLGNNPNVSCIPCGEYPYRVALSPARGVAVVWVDNVPERTSIQLHPGNYTSQLRGCLAVGKAVTDLNNDGTLDVTDSQATFTKFMEAIPAKGIIRFRSEEHTSELQSLWYISYAVFCLKKKNTRLNSSHCGTSRMPSSA